MNSCVEIPEAGATWISIICESNLIGRLPLPLRGPGGADQLTIHGTPHDSQLNQKLSRHSILSQGLYESELSSWIAHCGAIWIIRESNLVGRLPLPVRGPGGAGQLIAHVITHDSQLNQKLSTLSVFSQGRFESEQHDSPLKNRAEPLSPLKQFDIPTIETRKPQVGPPASLRGAGGPDRQACSNIRINICISPMHI